MEIISTHLDEMDAGSILPGYSYTYRTLIIKNRKHMTTSAKLISGKFNGII